MVYHEFRNFQYHGGGNATKRMRICQIILKAKAELCFFLRNKISIYGRAHHKNSVGSGGV